MHLSVKVFIDHTIGRVLCYGLFPFVRIVGLILRRDHSIRENNVNTIAVAKYYGLGSIVHSMPMLRALKEKYPGAKLILITRRNNQALFDHFPCIDEVLYVNDTSIISLAISSIRLFSRLVYCRIDLFFDLELFSAYGALVSLFSLARNRMGFLCGLETDFKTLLYTHLMYFNFDMPIRICYLQLAQLANISSNASPDLIVPIIEEGIRETARKKLNNILPGVKENRKLLAINVNASELLRERRWMLDRFEAVARHFVELDYYILFVGSPEEHTYVQNITNCMVDISDKVHNVAGKFTLSEFLAVLQQCNILLTVDTGTMNFGYALKVPTVSMYGPCNAKQYHIEGIRNCAISKKVYCSPCVHRFTHPPCKGDNICMSLITVDEVISSMKKLLNGGKKEHQKGHFPVLTDMKGAPLGFLRSRTKKYRKENRNVCSM